MSTQLSLPIKYFHRKLPNPNGPLSASFTSGTITLANREVIKITDGEAGMKHGPYAK